MELLIGMAGMVLILSVFGLGVCLGAMLRGRDHGDPEPPKTYVDGRSTEEIEKERKRLIAEQEAFRQQMEYNAEMAYGMSGNEEMYK
jgi:hypothetical protein